MQMFDRMLVGYDGSEAGKNALRQAVRLAGKVGGEVEVLTATPPPEAGVEYMDMVTLHSAMGDMAHDTLEDAMHMAKDAGAKAHGTVVEGMPAMSLVDTADTYGFKTIVLGHRELGRMERLIVGSVTTRVIARSMHDVLVVPEGAEVGWDEIVLTTDGQACSLGAQARAMSFARMFGSRLHVVSVMDFNDEQYALDLGTVGDREAEMLSTLDEIATQARELGITVDTALREGSPAKGILAYAEEKGARMVFMGSHGRGALGRLALGSVVQGVLSHAKVPVMVVKACADH
jgi:nucleotide-binding universal stress UspA family protein